MTGFVGEGHYITPCNLLTYDPAGIERHTYHLASVDPSQLPIVNRILSCNFDSLLFSQYTGLGGDWSPSDLRACLTINRPFLLTSMEELFREMTAPGFARDLFIDSIGRLLMVEIARHFKSFPQEKRSYTKRLAQTHLDRIFEYVDAASGHKVTLQELADTCGLSVDHLRRAFKDSTGQSLGAYVEQVRITKAKKLLAERRLTLKQIAHHVGFARPNSFSAAFHLATGETPKAYRLRHLVD